MPWAFSRTDVDPNPHAVIVSWAGPIFGGLFPSLVAWAARRSPRRWSRAATFFAGFSLIANGAYLATAPVMPAGDTEDLLRLGMPAWVMAGTGIPMVGAGLWLWHTLGKGRSKAVKPP